MESQSSKGSLPGLLIKSASAGMIHIEEAVYNRINPEYRAGKCRFACAPADGRQVYFNF